MAFLLYQAVFWHRPKNDALWLGMYNHRSGVALATRHVLRLSTWA